MAMIQCPNCNSIINNENAVFCPNCGTRIVRPVEEPAEQTPVVEPAPVAEQTPAAEPVPVAVPMPEVQTPAAPTQNAEPVAEQNSNEPQSYQPPQYQQSQYQPPQYQQPQYQPPQYQQPQYQPPQYQPPQYQQPQYQQPQYQQPQYAQPVAPQNRLGSNGVGIAGFVLGVIAFLVGVIGWLIFGGVAGATAYLPDIAAALMILFAMLIVAMLPGIPGFVLSLVSICRKGVKKGLAIAGFILNTLTVASFVLLMTLMAHYGIAFADLLRYVDY